MISLTGPQQHIGTFNIESGRLVVSDPCYDLDLSPGLQFAFDKVRCGEWKSFLVMSKGSWPGRLALVAHHVDFRVRDFYEFSRINQVAVDSGIMGFYDFPKFRADELVDPNEPDVKEILEKYGESSTKGGLWYAYCLARLEKSEFDASVINGGVVSGTGIGDGIYDLYAVENSNHEVVGVMVVFDYLEDDEDDDWDDDEDFDDDNDE